MGLFIVTFQLKSFYDDETYDKNVISTKEFQADSLEDLFERLDDIDEIEKVDDQMVINDCTDDEPLEINVEYVLIHDSNGQVLYKDDDYKSDSEAEDMSDDNDKFSTGAVAMEQSTNDCTSKTNTSENKNDKVNVNKL